MVFWSGGAGIIMKITHTRVSRAAAAAREFHNHISIDFRLPESVTDSFPIRERLRAVIGSIIKLNDLSVFAERCLAEKERKLLLPQKTHVKFPILADN